MWHVNYNFTEHHWELNKASFMAPLKQFVFDNYFSLIIIEYFVLINMRKLESN